VIRDIESSDIPLIEAIHRASGLDYNLPDITGPLFLNRIVSTDGSNIVAAALHHICYETWALVDPGARPQEKWAALREINDELSNRAYWQGLDLTHASVPPIGFDRRLRLLGWEPDRDGWRLWSRPTNEIGRRPSR
jgi:hypothetical protein